MNSGKKFDKKLNDSDIKTPKQIKWESIPKTPYNTRKRSFLSYYHKYPSNQFVNVGVKNTNNNHYSPDEPEDKYDFDIEGNQYKIVANKRQHYLNVQCFQKGLICRRSIRASANGRSK